MVKPLFNSTEVFLFNNQFLLMCFSKEKNFGFQPK